MRPSKPMLGLLLMLAALPATAATWRLDPVHSRVAFIVDHAGLSRAIGTFGGVHGRLEFDAADWRGARVEAAVPLAGLDLGDDEWERRVLDGTFLDAGDHPLATFASTAVEPAGEDRVRIAGDLTIRGVTRPVVLDARVNAVKRHPITRRRSAGFSATAIVDRRDFGIDAWPNVIGHSIEVLIEIEAILDPEAVAPPLPLPAPAPAPATATATEESADAADPQH